MRYQELCLENSYPSISDIIKAYSPFEGIFRAIFALGVVLVPVDAFLSQPPVRLHHIIEGVQLTTIIEIDWPCAFFFSWNLGSNRQFLSVGKRCYSYEDIKKFGQYGYLYFSTEFWDHNWKDCSLTDRSLEGITFQGFWVNWIPIWNSQIQKKTRKLLKLSNLIII